MKSSLLRLCQLLLALCTVHIASSFTVQVQQHRGQKSLMAENVNGETGDTRLKIKRVLKRVYKKLAFGDKRSMIIEPKTKKEEGEMTEKYAQIDDVEELAFQVLLDLGLVKETKGSVKKL